MSLSGHRLAAVEFAEVTTAYPRVIGRNARLGSHGSGPTAPIAIVRTDSGVVGWGLTRRDPGAAEQLRGAALDELIDPATGVVDERAAALDFALHDLAGHVLEIPVHQLLGGHGEPSVTCYDGAIYLDDLDPEDAPRGIDVVLANCAADYELGFRAFKLKIGRGNRWMAPDDGLRRDIEVTRAVRANYPDCRILVDANNGYSVTGFCDYLTAVLDCDLFWVEEPFPEAESDLERLRAFLGEHGAKTLIADGEYEPDEAQLLQLSERGLLDVLLMDVMSYGLTPWRRIMPTLVELGVHASPHAWGLPLKSLYAAQMAAGLGNVITVEGVPGRTVDVDTTAYQLVDGILQVPSTPGFGIPLPAGMG